MVQTQESTVTDEVWASVPERTGLLPRRTAAIIAVITMALLAAGGAVDALAGAGAFSPRVELDDSGWDGSFFLPDGRVVPAISPWTSDDAITTIWLANTGWVDEWVLNVAVEGDGLEFVGDRIRGADTDIWSAGFQPVSLANPYLLRPGERADVGIEVRITDCRAVGDPPLVLTVRDWRGTRAVDLSMTRVRHFDAGWSVSTPDDPRGESGFRYLADKTCAAS